MTNETNKNKTVPTDETLKDVAGEEINAQQAAAESLPNNITADAIADSLAADLKNQEEMKKHLDAAADSSLDGVNGAKMPSTMSHIGKAKTVVATNMFKGTRQATAVSAGEFETQTVSDLDKYGQQERLAAAAYDNVQAIIKHESTKNIEMGDAAIIGQPTDNGVYSDESMIVEETITNIGVKDPIESPRHRRIGTQYHVTSSIANLTGDEVSGLNTEDTANGKPLYSQVYFNRLAPNKNYSSVISGEFVAPKLGKYWIRGINPFAKAGNCISKITSLDNTVIRGYSDWDETTPSNPIYAKVYQHQDTDTDSRLFDVVDLTPFVNNVRAANKRVMSTLTNVKGKMKFGLYEALAKQMDYVAACFDGDADAAKMWPDYYMSRKRSTLWDGNRNGDPALASQACYNQPESFFRYMEAVRSLEALALPVTSIGLNDSNIIKFFKGQTGKRNTDPFFDKYSGYSQKQSGIGSSTGVSKSIHGPNVVPFARYIDSTAAFNTAGKWLFTFRNYKARIMADIGIMSEDPLFSSMITPLKALSTALQEMIDTLSVGRVVSDEDMTSNAIIKLGGSIDIIADCDPNDLVQCIKTGSHTEWYPSCGYVNIYRDDDQRYARYETFYILPKSIDIIINAMKDVRLFPLFYNDLTSTTYYEPGGASGDNLYKWLCGSTTDTVAERKYIPIQLNTTEGQLYPHLFMECFKIASVSCIKNNVKNGFNRYLTACDKFGFTDIINDYYDVDGRQLFDSILKNDQLKINASWQTPDQFPILWKTARDNFLDRDNRLLAQITTNWFTGGTNGPLKMMVYHPQEHFSNITNTKGLTFVNMEHGNDDGVSVIDDLIDVNNKNDLFAELSKTKYSKIKLGDMSILTGITVQIGGTQKNGDSYSALDAKDATAIFDVMVEGADAEYLNYTDDIGVKLYGRDYHYITEHDTYLVGYTTGTYTDAVKLKTGEGYEFKGKIMLLPADYLSLENGQFKPVNGTKPGSASRNAYNADASETIMVEDTVVTANAMIQYGERTAKQKACVAYRILCRPSLYGTHRIAPFGSTHICSNWNGRKLDLYIAGKDKVTDDYYYSAPEHADMIFAVAPKVLGLDFNDTNGSWDWDTAQLIEHHRADLGDESYYVSQELFAGDDDTRYFTGGNSSNANWKYTIKSFLDYANDVFNVRVYLANSPHADPRIYQAYLFKLDDANRRLLNYRHAGLLSKALVSTALDTSATFTSRFIIPINGLVSREYLSEQAFNDYRLFHIGKPPVFFDRESRFTGNYRSLMWENYIKKQ